MALLASGVVPFQFRTHPYLILFTVVPKYIFSGDLLFHLFGGLYIVDSWGYHAIEFFQMSSRLSFDRSC